MPTGLGDEKLWLCPSLNDSADDISGNGNHGTYNGGMSTVADTSNGGVKAYSFDGYDDYVALPTSGVSSSKNLNSFSMWVNPDSISSTAVIFNAGTASSGNRFINIGVNSTGNILCGRSNDWLIAGSHTASSWYHLCVISNGTSISLYKDGSLIGSRTDAAVAYTETACRLGGFISNTNAQYDGLLDDLRVFDRALTQTEITHLATSRGIEGNPYDYNGLGDEKLWLCPSLDDSADDISGNGNHGTYNGGMSTVADTSNGGVKAYSFDGWNDFIDCGEVVVTSGIGISLWMKRNEVSNFVSVVTKYDSSVGASSPFSPYYVMSSVSGNGIRGYLGEASINSFKAEEYGSTVANNSWSHVAISCSLGSSKINIFINGSLVTSNTIANSTFSSVSSGSGIKTLIGARQNSSSTERFLNGYLDDIRIFDRALSTTEITALASKRGYQTSTGIRRINFSGGFQQLTGGFSG